MFKTNIVHKSGLDRSVGFYYELNKAIKNIEIIFLNERDKEKKRYRYYNKCSLA